MQRLLLPQERLLASLTRSALRSGVRQRLPFGGFPSQRLQFPRLSGSERRQRSRSTVTRAASHNGASVTPSLEPHNFPSPFHHERAKYQKGKGSLKSSAWEVLKHHPQGLAAGELVSEIGKMGEYESGDEAMVEGHLQEDVYFFREDDGKWMLSIYKPLNWGIAGTAQIAEDVVEAMQLVPGVRVAAVAAGSSKEKAENFAKEHGVERAYGSYDDLAKDPEVDLVYISNLHTQHKDTVLTMAEAGKNILCEKPLSVNKKDTQTMIQAAEKAGVFFMAGLWSRFFPAQKLLKQLIEEGELGDILYFEGKIFLQMGEETKRLYDPEMGGGALLDIGLYMIALGSWVFGGGKPAVLQPTALIHKQGIDTTGSVNLKYPGKGIAHVSYSMALDAPIEATVFGTKGTVKIHDRAHNPTKLTFTPTDGGHEILYEFPQPPKPDTISHGSAEGGWNFGGSMGFVYEVMAVHSAVVKGTKELCSVSQQEMLDLMEITDEIREHIGVSYPMDSDEQKQKTMDTANTV